MQTEAQPNRLAKEKSPYLLQHASNPVDWYPWGAEAFEKARKDDKPILVSIGYSTCHWCHVMERESYENRELAALMNQYLVNIKVDREERPDVDKIYMTAVQALTGSGGWPLNVFLTPDLKPFFGGTYFPPASRMGQPGWGDVVKKIGESWKNPADRTRILEAGQSLTDALKQYAASAQAPLEGKVEWLENACKVFRASFDASRGGFSRAPKFPMPVYHFFLMRYEMRDPASRAKDMSFKTLEAMARGGLYDQLGGGFARYSTDADWHVPHFEKMLYDNAQLAVNYLEAYQIDKNPEFMQVARETLDYLRRDMTHPDGGFYSAEDADSHPAKDSKEKVEGAFYVWEIKELRERLSAEACALFAFRYGVRENGNAAQDPHGEFKNKNILYEAHTLAESAREFKLSPDDARAQLDQAKRILLAARAKRPRPHLDDKIISAWNGLALSAFAKAYQVLGDEADLQAARQAARFLKTNLYDPKLRILYRRWRSGERNVLGIADDYAFVVQGLLDLYESEFDTAWLVWAEELTDIMIERFYDKENGGFFMTAVDQDEHLLVRVREDQDNVEPAASSVAVLNLLRLAQFRDQMEYRSIALRTLQAFGNTIKETPMAMPTMLAALDYSLSDPRQIVIAGTPGAPDTQALLRVLQAHYMPVKIAILVEGGAHQAELSKRLSFLKGMRPVGGKATAYVCEHFVCKNPVTDPAEFEKQLRN